MRVQACAFGLLAATGILWAMGGTQHERPVLAAGAADTVRGLEANAEMHPADPQATERLAQAYLDARQPGLAIVLFESAASDVQETPRVRHAYARALVDAGRSDEALAAEQHVVERCAPVVNGVAVAGCDSVLLASAMRRADILRELVSLGVQDAQAHPEESLVAYQNATREARVMVASVE